MAVWQPSRRELVVGAPLLLGAAALPRAAGAVPSRNLRVLVLGDWGRDGGHHQKKVAALMAHEARNSGCDLVVTTGDNFYSFGVASVDDRQWRTSYEDIYAPELRRLPWFPVAGNHDWGGNIFAQLDRTGNGGWHMPWLWYDIPGLRFGRPDIHFFFIDTTVWKGREEKLHRICGHAIHPEHTVRQKRWLADALRASCAPTKIVFGHHPIYHESGTRSLDDLDDMLIEAGVTAYVFGHKHCLYHVKGAKLDHICSGGGSEERSEFRGGNFAPRCPGGDTCEPPRMERYIERAGFATLDIGADALSFTFTDRDGAVTPPTAVRSRGGRGLPCSALPPVDLAAERTAVRTRSTLPCAKLL
jgi:acid phosphatase